jgi:hypothetical protein
MLITANDAVQHTVNNLGTPVAVLGFTLLRPEK